MCYVNLRFTLLYLQAITDSNNCGSIEDRAVKFACSSGFYIIIIDTFLYRCKVVISGGLLPSFHRYQVILLGDRGT